MRLVPVLAGRVVLPDLAEVVGDARTLIQSLCSQMRLAMASRFHLRSGAQSCPFHSRLSLCKPGQTVIGLGTI